MAKSANTSPKHATRATSRANAAARRALPFNDDQDFEDARRGFIATLDEPVIQGQAKRPVWNLKDYAFLQESAESPDTVHPGLWRQSRLLAIHGLFKVDEHIYQVRSFDISNMTFIEGDDGIIIFDPLISAECARAALDLYYRHRPFKPVAAVVYSHTHVDHFGGVMGVTTPEDAAAGRVQILAPEHFMYYVLGENMVARNAMVRRATYMFGPLLPKGERGQVSTGLGLTTSSGTVGLIPPTVSITHTGQEVTMAGVRMLFQLTPGTEAPVEMNTYFPQWRALWMAENCTHTLHNLYTPRGAEVRDGKAWAHYIDEAIELYGHESEVVFASHHWPQWGGQRILGYLRKQRALYKYLHDQTLRLANHGYTINEIAEQVELPPALSREWYNRGFYGTVSHNVKAQYQKYFGWFDANPAHLNPLPPEQAGKKYVAFMGGAEAVLEKARTAFDEGEYRWVTEVVNHVVFADPANQAARALQADALEQLGYQAESGPWRNFYLTGAGELRYYGETESQPRAVDDVGMLAAISPADFFDFLSVRLNAAKAQGKAIRMHVEFTDDGESYCLSVDHCVLVYGKPRDEAEADVTLRAPRLVLFQALLGLVDLHESVNEGRMAFSGDESKFSTLVNLFDQFDPWFNIVTP